MVVLSNLECPLAKWLCRLTNNYQSPHNGIKGRKPKTPLKTWQNTTDQNSALICSGCWTLLSMIELNQTSCQGSLEKVLSWVIIVYGIFSGVGMTSRWPVPGAFSPTMMFCMVTEGTGSHIGPTSVTMKESTKEYDAMGHAVVSVSSQYNLGYLPVLSSCSVYAAWNVAVRQDWALPHRTHRYLIDTISGCLNPEVMLASRCFARECGCEVWVKSRQVYPHPIPWGVEDLISLAYVINQLLWSY